MVFLVLLWLAMFIAMTVLLVLIVTTLIQGASRLDLRLFTEYPASSPARAGARPAILGSIWVIGTTAVLAIPLGVAAAVQLEEFADKTKRINHLIEVNVQNLAAIPSVVYGLLALAVLTLVGVQNKNLVIAGATALGLLILPVIIIATREALRSVPAEIREGSLALGATPLQTMWRQTLPQRCRASPLERSWRCRGHWARRRRSSCSGVGVRQLRPERAAEWLHHHADPDLQLDRSSPGGVPRPRRRGQHCPARPPAGHERPRHLHP